MCLENSSQQNCCLWKLPFQPSGQIIPTIASQGGKLNHFIWTWKRAQFGNTPCAALSTTHHILWLGVAKGLSTQRQATKEVNSCVLLLIASITCSFSHLITKDSMIILEWKPKIMVWAFFSFLPYLVVWFRKMQIIRKTTTNIPVQISCNSPICTKYVAFFSDPIYHKPLTTFFWIYWSSAFVFSSPEYWQVRTIGEPQISAICSIILFSNKEKQELARYANSHTDVEIYFSKPHRLWYYTVRGWNTLFKVDLIRHNCW